MPNEALEKVQGSAVPARPAHIQEGNRGQELITNKDIVIPRLGLCQSTTPQRKRTNPNYIPGLEEGQLFNSVTGTIYGTSIDVIPLFFFKSRIWFKDLDQGGGILCQAPDGKSCQLNAGGPCLHSAWGKDGSKPECTEFMNYFCLIQPTNELIVVSLKSTGMKAGKNWNMLIRLRKADMFAGVYTIQAVTAQNAANQEYSTFVIKNAEGDKAWATVEQLRYAENEYKQVHEGFAQGYITVAAPENLPDDGNDAIGSRDAEM